jgi:hypothetical protein
MTLKELETALNKDQQAIARELMDVIIGVPEEDLDGESGIDVRLQVNRFGRWTVHSGDACYDTDHNGYWGSGLMCLTDTLADALITAAELIDQACDDFAQSGEGE